MKWFSNLFGYKFPPVGSDGKIGCKNCGARILPSTAEKNKGLCMPCVKGNRTDNKPKTTEDNDYGRANFHNTFEKMAQQAVYVELQCNDMSDMPSSDGPFALAVFADPIPNKQELLNTRVSPTFRFMKVEDLVFLFIELEFIDRNRNLVLGSTYSGENTKAFIRAAKSLGFFWINDRPFTADGIQISIVKPEVLDELLDEIPS